MKSYTDIEQSKKLAEILPVESADMRYAPFGDTHPWVWDDNLLEKGAIPCWSLAALLGMLPSEFEYYETTYKIDIRKYALTDDIDLYQIAYGNYKFYEDGNKSWKDMINSSEKEDLLDACYEIITKLHKLNLL